MTDLTIAAPERPGFDLSISRQWIVELAALNRPAEAVRDQAATLFQAQNPEADHSEARTVLGRAAQAADAGLRQLHRTRKDTDSIETVITGERPDRPHRLYRIAGIGTAILGTALLVPMVLVAAAGVQESLLIERVIDAPLWALAYGTAPVGGVLAAHGIRDTLKTDRARRWFDRAAYLAAIAAFGYWAVGFGPVFLTDPLAGGFGAAAATKATLSDWYARHLALEFAASAAAYSAATHLLTYGARKIARKAPEAEALETAIAEETSEALSLAAQRDALAAAPRQYDAALRAFQDRVVLKVEMARHILEAHSARDSVTALAELKRDWTAFETEDNPHA